MGNIADAIEELSYVDSLLSTGFNTEEDIDTVGITNCCGDLVDESHVIVDGNTDCQVCDEPCKVEEVAEYELDKWFDNYLEDHPDFEEAFNLG